LNVERKKSLKSHRLFRGFSIDSGTSSQSNGSGNSNINNGRFRKRASKSGQAVFMNDDFAVHEEILPTIHPLIKKNLTAVLQPTIVRIIHADPCVGLEFREQMLVTTDRRGRTRTWGRP
jgi:hypothetical protein